MHLCKLAALAPLVAVTVAQAKDVTLFVVGTPTTTGISGEPPIASVTYFGGTALSTNEAGATYYAYSGAVSFLDDEFTEPPYTITETALVDATRFLRHGSSSISGGGVQENKLECIHHENGTSVCENIIVYKDAETTITWVDRTYTGTPSPMVTITSLEAVEEDGGSAGNGVGFTGTIVAALGLGFGLALA